MEDPYLADLYRDANDVIRGLKPTIGGAVNWADLRCVEARHVVAHCGEYEVESFEVLVEEASPSADALRSAVSAGLVEKGHVGVNVVTEW